jgi:hypothetical protein
MADNLNQNLKISERILKIRQKIAALEEQGNDISEEHQKILSQHESTLAKLVKYQETRLRNTLGTKQAELDIQKTFSSQVADLSSISSIYSSLTLKQKESLKTTQSIVSSVQTSLLADEHREQILNSTLSGVTELQGLQQKLAETGPEELEVQESIRDVYNSKLNALQEEIVVRKALGQVTQQEADALMKVLDIQQESLASAERYATLSEDTKKFIEAQIDAYKGINKTISGVINTAKVLTSTVGGTFGIALIGAGMFAGKLGEIAKALGGVRDIGTTALSFIDDNAVENAKALSKEFGGMNNVTIGLQASTSLIASNMGISGAEAASLLGTFSRLNGNSTDVAKDLMVSTQEFAKQNGIIPSELMADLASNTEAFALYGKNGGKNIIQAAGYAKKLGVEFSKLTGIADNLLDFESSITKELELGAMLGKNINLDRARALAFEGDIEGATKETLKALGGVEEFNKMDYFAKKASADLLGVSVDELQKMVNNQKEADTLSGKLNEKFSYLSEGASYIANEWGGGILKSMGGALVAAGQLGGSFAQMGMDVKGMASNIPVIGKFFGGAKPNDTSVTDKLTQTTTTPKTPQITDTANPAKKGGIMDSLSKIKMNDVLKGAAALVIVAGAVFVFGKAVQEFMEVSWEAVGMAVVSMLALVGAVTALGLLMSSGIGAVAILAGAAAMLVIATSVLVLGNALQSIGTGFEMLSSGISTLVPNLVGIGETIASLVMVIPAITALSLSLMGLSASLVAVGAAGILAAPGLMALSTVGTIATGLGSLLGIGGDDGVGSGDSMKILVDEIRGLREDLKSGKIGVYMDGTAVASKISKVVDRIGVNSYS